jgi:hypothetical protein
VPSATYSAGTAYLTVVPSMLGLEDALKAGVRDAAAKADRDLAKQMAQGLKETQAAARNAGTKVGENYAGSYEAEAKKRLEQAWKALPEPQPDVDLRKWDKRLATLRGELKDLGDQRIGIDIDQKTFDKAIDDFRKRLESLRDSASGKNADVGFFNADQAAHSLAELQKFTDNASRLAGEGGDQIGSSFNQRLSKALDSGLAKIPPIKLTGDPSDAERAIAEVRDRMVELQNKRIGVDIDAGEAFTELKAIQALLDKLDRKSVSVDIRTNAHDAAAGMAAFIQEAEQAGRATEGIGASSNFSLSRLETLIALGVSLGTSIVPAAAAAAGAVGTIGGAAIAALSGIGVFALGISGISDAVKALNQYSNDSAKSANNVAQANRSMAASTAQVQQAEASLANTRRTVAQGAQDAARKVADAERGVADARRDAAQEQRDAALAVKDARRQVADAQRDIADAERANARDLADADRQVRDAQRGLTDAESNALDVRKDLNTAIQDATRNMEELGVSIQKNEADQEDAVASQMKALAELNALKANPRATEQEILAAKASYDQQTAQIAGLQQKHKELAQDKAKYDKQGIEGDSEVIAARKKIADADRSVADARDKLAREQDDRRETEIKNEERLSNAQERASKAQEQVSKALSSQRQTELKAQEKIANAERSVADARRAQARQQLDGQYQIQQAVNSVTSAQRSQQQAWEKTGLAGGDALNTLNQKMGELSPTAQNFARFIFGLKDEFKGLRAAASDPLLPGLQVAITTLLQYLPAVERFVSKVAAALGNIAVEAVNSLGNPVWQRFFHFIDDTAVPSLDTMYEISSNLAQGLISLFLALTPFNNDVGGGLVRLSQDFARWAEEFDKTKGYQQFLQYIKENGPRVVDLLGQTGELFIDLVKASAPLGSIVLRVVLALVDGLNSLPVPVLTVLVGAIGAVALALTVLGARAKVLKLKDILIDTFGPKQSALVQQYAERTGTATDALGRFGKASAATSQFAVNAAGKVQSISTAMANLPGRLNDAVNGTGAFSRGLDAVSTGATNTVSGLMRVDAAAGTAAKGGLLRAKGALLDIAAATSGPGGLAAGVQTTGEKIGGLASGVGNASTKLGGMAKQAGAAGAALGTKLMAGLGSVVSFLGGPWGIALAVGSLALSYFATKSSEQKQRVDTLTQALGELSAKYTELSASGRQAGADADEAFKQIVQNNPQLQKAVITLSQLGISFQDMVKASASGDPSAVVAKLNAAIQDQAAIAQRYDVYRNTKGVATAEAQKKNLEDLRDAFVQNATAMGQAAQANSVLTQDTDRNQLVLVAQANAAKTGAAAQVNLINTYDQNATAITALNGLVSTYSSLQSTAQQRSDAVKAAIQAETGAMQDQTDANETLAQKMINLRDQVNQAKAAHDKNATSMNLSSASALRNRDAVEDVASSIRNMYLQDIASGKPIADATKLHNDRIKALKDEAAKLGLTKTETQNLINTYGNIPKNINTVVKMDPNSFNAVYENLQRMQFMQSELKIGRTADQAAADWSDYKREMNRALLKADGGAIHGPGTGTSDSIPARLSNNEHVWTAEEVDAAGGHGVVEAMRAQVLKNPRRPGFSDGGAVETRPPARFANGGKASTATFPFPVNVNGSWVPSADWVRANTEVPNIDGAFTGLSPDASVAKIQKFALAQRGKRYLWSAVGPDRYDCCIVAGVRIYGPDGAKPIEDVRAGDRVYSYVDGKLTSHAVTAAWQSIHQPVFKVRTRNRTVTASANHPFLRVVKTGTERVQKVDDGEWPGPITGRRRGIHECSVSTCTSRSRTYGLCPKHAGRYEKYGDPRVAWESTRATFGTEWSRVDHLNRGDLLVQPRIMPTDPIGMPTLADGTVIDQDVAWLIGASVGDGTVTDSGLRLCLFGEYRERAIGIIEQKWGGKPRRGESYGIVVSNVRVARAMTALGMRCLGPDKRVPQAVWSWEPALQRAFLEGYCDADGHRPADQARHGERTYHSASRQLIEDARALHLALGDPVSNITVTKRAKPIVIKGKTVKNARDQHSFAVWPRSKKSDGEARLRQAPGLAEWLEGKDFTVAPLLAVDPDGEQDTWDLEVEDAHNFIADGVVVHNSGLVGNLWALATGHSLYHRYMSTADMGPGRHGMVAGPGKKMTIYLGPGHTAANVGGLHVEAYGGNGVPLAIGRIGERLSYYTQKLHLPGFAAGGPVDASGVQDPKDRLLSFLQRGWPEPPPGASFADVLKAQMAGSTFDGGGMLPPGLSTVLNATGSPEPVLTGQQWKDISELARNAASGKGGNTYNYEFRDTTLTPGFLRAQQDRDAVLARAGRPG